MIDHAFSPARWHSHSSSVPFVTSPAQRQQTMVVDPTKNGGRFTRFMDDNCGQQSTTTQHNMDMLAFLFSPRGILPPQNKWWKTTSVGGTPWRPWYPWHHVVVEHFTLKCDFLYLPMFAADIQFISNNPSNICYVHISEYPQKSLIATPTCQCSTIRQPAVHHKDEDETKEPPSSIGVGGIGQEQHHDHRGWQETWQWQPSNNDWWAVIFAIPKTIVSQPSLNIAKKNIFEPNHMIGWMADQWSINP